MSVGALNTIWDILTTGGPTAVAMLFGVAWWLEHRAHRETRQSNLEISTKHSELSLRQVEQQERLRASIDSLTQVLNHLLRKEL